MWQSGLPPLCVLWHSCHHRPFPSQRQQKAGQSSPNLHPRDFSRLLAFKYLFHHYKTVFPKKKATALFCCDFWNDFADMKWGKNKHTQFCSLPDLRGLWSGSLREVYLAKWPRVFPVSAPETSASSRRKHSLGASSGVDGWCQQWWGGQLRAINTSPAACWVHQKVPELTFYCPQGEKYHPSSFQSHNIFQGTSMSVIWMKRKKKSLKTNSQKPLQLLLFTTRTVPQVSVYTTHIKNNWLIYQSYEIPVF